MHILIAILGAAAAALFFIYRIYLAVQAGREVADRIGDPRRFARRFRWARKVRGNPLETLEDPREAATVLMLAVARTEGELTDAARDTIRAQMRRYFGMSGEAAEAMLRQLAWMTREMTDITPRMRHLAALLRRHCTAAEREDVAAMLDEVAQASGGPTPMRRQIIQRYRQILREQEDPAAL
ncbi:MAG: TerB family tellurite resistance protein [Alphaproteobacteria bacterium]